MTDTRYQELVAKWREGEESESLREQDHDHWGSACAGDILLARLKCADELEQAIAAQPEPRGERDVQEVTMSDRLAHQARRIVDLERELAAQRAPEPRQTTKCAKCGGDELEEEGYESGGPQGWIVTKVGGCPECLRRIIADLECRAGAPEPRYQGVREAIADLHQRARAKAKKYIRSGTLYAEYHGIEVAYETVLKLMDAESNRLERLAAAEPREMTAEQVRNRDWEGGHGH
jgi:hypothetical protein